MHPHRPDPRLLQECGVTLFFFIPSSWGARGGRTPAAGFDGTSP